MFPSVERVVAKFVEILIMKGKTLQMSKNSDGSVINNCLIINNNIIIIIIINNCLILIMVYIPFALYNPSEIKLSNQILWKVSIINNNK